MVIPIYKAELDLGLADLIRSQSSIAYVSQVEPYTPNTIELARADEILKNAKATNEGQIDLYYLKTILVTVGWNKNDDVFDRKETWAARYTPEDKPFNLEHDPRRIRGHITGNYVIDDGGKVVPDNATIDDLPTKYHVVTNAVLYKFLKSKDEELEKEMKTVIAQIEKGEWYVSMECVFPNFDYAVTDGSNRTTIVPRNEESAFLTKHLRAYGGDGEYENYKIGRLLRNITFTGKGLVKRPANPESIIFREVASIKLVAQKEFKELQTDVGYSSVSNNDSNKESNEMADVNPQVEVLTERTKSLETTLSTLQKKNEELEKRLQDSNEKQVQAKISDLETQIKTLNDKNTSLEAQIKVEQTARTEAEAKVTETTKKVTELEKEVNTAKAEKAFASRVSSWMSHTGIEKDKAEKAVTALAALDDTSFASFLETQPKKVEEQKKNDDKNKNKDSSKADTTVIDNADKTKDAPLVTGGVDDNIEQTRANLGKFLKNNFLGSNRNRATADSGK